MTFNASNILSTIGLIAAALLGLMGTILGCSTDAAGVTTCTSSWLNTTTAGYAIMAFSAIGLIAKAVQPGGWLYGLFGQSAPVVPDNKANSVAGTVTPEQVAAP